MAKEQDVIAQRLKRHAAGERVLGAALLRYFADQQKRITKALADFDEITTAAVSQVFIPDDEHKLLIKAVDPILLKLMATGAGTELAEVPRPVKPVKAYRLDPFNLPKEIRDAIRAALDELEGETYWQEIQATTSEQLTKIINTGIGEGWNGWKMKKAINEALGGMAKVRAALIARTETSGAYEHSHNVVRQRLAADGLITGKKWLSIKNALTRDDHRAAHGQEVAPGDDFEVGGEKTPYPAWHGLSAKQRVNCRCTTVSTYPE